MNKQPHTHIRQKALGPKPSIAVEMLQPPTYAMAAYRRGCAATRFPRGQDFRFLYLPVVHFSIIYNSYEQEAEISVMMSPQTVFPHLSTQGHWQTKPSTSNLPNTSVGNLDWLEIKNIYLYCLHMLTCFLLGAFASLPWAQSDDVR